MLRPIACVMLCLAAAQDAALAHHSYGAYFREQTVAIEGVLEQLSIVNPHSILEVRTDDGTLITAEWGAIAQLARTGYVAGMLAVGDRVIVSACPPRDPESHRVALVSEVRRPRDGWRWTKFGMPTAQAPR